MNKAEVQQVADPLTVYNHPANCFVAGFIGSPPMNFIRGTIASGSGSLYFDEGSFRLRIVDEMWDRLARYEHALVLFGIRPEDLHDKLFISDAPVDSVVTSSVEVVEPMGSEVYLHLKVGQHPLVARVGPHDRPEVNQDIDLVFDMGKAHFFDAQTEAVLV
jgi:multiple sugar transport system ATP-binding protein